MSLYIFLPSQTSHKSTGSGSAPALICSIPKISPEMQPQLPDVMGKLMFQTCVSIMIILHSYLTDTRAPPAQPTQLNQRKHVSGHHHGMISTEYIGKGKDIYYM